MRLDYDQRKKVDYIAEMRFRKAQILDVKARSWKAQPEEIRRKYELFLEDWKDLYEIQEAKRAKPERGYEKIDLVGQEEEPLPLCVKQEADVIPREIGICDEVTHVEMQENEEAHENAARDQDDILDENKFLEVTFDSPLNIDPSMVPEDITKRFVFALKLPSIISKLTNSSLVPACAGRYGRGKGRGKRQRGAPKRQGRRGNENGNYSANHMTVSTFRATLMPSQIRVKMKMEFLFQLTAASNIIVRRFNPNSLYQPDVGGPTATMPGFADYAQLYGFYRVLGYSYKVDIANMCTFPVAAYILNSNNDPSTSASLINVANPLSQKCMLSPTGGLDRHTFTKKVWISDVVGTNAVATADNYRALVTGSPADVTWLGIAIQASTGANVTPGAYVALSLFFYAEFYDRLAQT